MSLRIDYADIHPTHPPNYARVLKPVLSHILDISKEDHALSDGYSQRLEKTVAAIHAHMLHIESESILQCVQHANYKRYNRARPQSP